MRDKRKETRNEQGIISSFILPVFHGVGISEPFYNLGDGGSLLTDGHVDAVQLLLLVSGVVETLLVDDGINGDSSFASLTITNDLEETDDL